MTVVEAVFETSSLPTQYASFQKDAITLGWEERRQGHGKRRSDGGIEFAISLPGGMLLRAGQCLVLEAEQIIVAVIEANEPVFVLKPGLPGEWALYAYHVGNRHQSVMIQETELVCLQNPAVRSLLDQLHVAYTEDQRPFTGTLVGHQH